MYYPDGSPLDMDMMNLMLSINYSFAYKVDGTTLTFYKVRW